MCKKLSASMVVRCALGKHSCISYGELVNIKRELMSVGDGYLVDMSFRSVSRTVNTYDRELEIVDNQEGFAIKRKGKCKRSNLFDCNRLSKYYLGAFPVRDRSAIISILSRNRNVDKS